MRKISLAVCLVFVGLVATCQNTGLLSGHNHKFTLDDTLRGSITPERAWWDLLHYDLTLDVDISKKYFKGTNVVTYKVLESKTTLQIDLQPPMDIVVVTKDGENLTFEKIGNNAYMIKLNKKPIVGQIEELTVFFEGNPRVARRAPWDGGVSWKTDDKSRPFVATSCQGLGASVWWPCKDHMYDEPDNGMKITVTVPDKLMNVSNGLLTSNLLAENGKRTTVWEVKNPINNYGVNVNIGNYAHYTETYKGEKGDLRLDYWPLDYNLEKAKEHWQDVPRMLQAFEHWFGPYPFYEDGFKLVEVPYLGMEHQSSVTYGNQYKKGYLGRDLSGSGWGLKWDFIIIHESGHEWFANNITYKDIADMWIHEGFTSYSEALYTDYHFGKAAGEDYVIGIRGNIRNDSPIIGTYGVNKEGSGDMYSKGANILHTIRHIIGDDEKFRAILRGINSDFYHKTVSTQDIEDYIEAKSGKKLDKVFEQYLRTTMIPKFVTKQNGKKIEYKWDNVIEGFDMPVKVKIDGTVKILHPSKDKFKSIKGSTIEVDRNFYIQ